MSRSGIASLSQDLQAAIARLEGDLADARSEERDTVLVYVDDLHLALRAVAASAAADRAAPPAAAVKPDGVAAPQVEVRDPTPYLTAVASDLTESQRRMVERTVAGVIAGLFCCADDADEIDGLPAGICRSRFEPNDYAERGHRHAARLTPFGLRLHRFLLEQNNA